MKRTCLIIASLAFLFAGCGGSGGSGSNHGGSGTAIRSTNGTVVAIDCKRNRAYVPVTPTGATDAEVAVLNLSVNPNQTNPLVKIIDLGYTGLARAAAVAPDKGLAFVISATPLGQGYLDIIKESDNKLVTGSPFSFPTGSRPYSTDGIVYDQLNDSALVSMTGSGLSCPGASSTCTGMAAFSLNTDSFGPLIQFNNPVDNFAYDPTTQIALAPSDHIDPTIYAVNAVGNMPCTLTDSNMTTLNADPDGAAVDSQTGVWVIGNFFSSQATVINLAGASFNAATSPCTLDEGGTPPNSVNFDTGTGVAMPGVAINPLTNQALMTAQLDNQVALLTLPSAPVTQLTSSDVSSVTSTIPDEPDGATFDAADFPFGDAIDTCHNRAYVLNDNHTFLVEIDLAKLQSDPSAISTPLPAGHCAGAITQFGCNNHNGVKFFPLPGA